MGPALKRGEVTSCGCNRIKDFTGQKFTMLTCVKPLRNKQNKLVHKNNSVIWKCRCDCGNNIYVSARYLVNMKSCGCLSKYDHGSIIENRLYSRYKRIAEKRNLTFKLSIREFLKLTIQRCYYCNMLPFNILKNKNGHGKYIYNGVDRLNNEKGYTIKNCVPCCKICNRMKLNMSENEFLNHIDKIYNLKDVEKLLDRDRG